MARAVGLLRVDLSGEHLLPDDGDAQLQALRHIGLEDNRAVANGLRVADIAVGDYAGQNLVHSLWRWLAFREHKGIVVGLAHGAAVVLAIEL